MQLSVTAPIASAIDRTRAILFEPFEIKKWFLLGFCAWLAYLGEGGGGGGGGGGNWNRGGRGPARELHSAIDWVQAHLAWVVAGVVAFLLIAVLLGVLIAWLRSRGMFMFLDGVVRNRGAVTEPWHQYRPHGNSLFVFSFVLGLIFFTLLLALLGAGFALAWPDLRAERFGANAIVALAVFFGLLLPAVTVYGVVGVLLGDFVVPAMYLRGESALVAWRTVWNEVVRPHSGTLVLYVLMKILMAIVVGLMALIVTCLTCCLAILPYLGTVILLPLIVFKRCYSLHFLQQLGPEWDCFAAVATPPGAGSPQATASPPC